MNIIRTSTVFLLLLHVGAAASAQTDLREVRHGNRQFSKKHWRQSEIEYMKGLAKDSTSFASSYNLSSALYREQKYDEAAKTIQMGAEKADGSANAADYYFNSGDIAIQKEDWKAAVDAFRKSLLLRPDDFEARENYTYAKMKLEEQQDQNQDQDQQDNQDQQNQNDQNQDQNQDQQNQDQQDQNQDQQDQQNQNQDQPQPQQPPKISPQQAQQMLSAIQAKEKETQDKVNKEKAALLQSRQKEKNW